MKCIKQVLRKNCMKCADTDSMDSQQSLSLGFIISELLASKPQDFRSEVLTEAAETTTLSADFIKEFWKLL